MAEADVGAIVAAAGVAHGTFYFHFPTKEHVLFELERQAEELQEAYAPWLALTVADKEDGWILMTASR